MGKKVNPEQENSLNRIHYFQKVLDYSLDLISTCDIEGKFVSMNKAVEQILGYTADELLGQEFIKFVHEDDVQRTNEKAADIFNGNSATNFENRYRRKDGQYVYISWCSIWSAEDQLIYGIARDVTEKKLQEQASEKLNNELQSQINLLNERNQTIDRIKEFEFFADSMPQIAWTATPDGNIDYYNKNWFEFTGMTLEETQGWGWAPVVHPDDLKNCIKLWSQSIKTGKPYEVEYRFKRASDGAYRWQLGRALAMFNDSGEVAKWFGTCTDIDDFKKAVEEANSSKRQLHAILNNAPLNIWSVDNHGIFTLAEGKGMVDSGLTSADFIGKSHFEMYKDAPKAVICVERALHGEEFSEETEVGNQVFRTSYAPLKDEHGVINGMVGVSLDITEEKHAETASQFKTRFLASMSHEIRTPLNAILGFSDILKKDNLPQVKRTEYLNHISSSGSILLKLIGDILDLSKIEEGKLDLNNESFYFKEVIQSSIMPYKHKVNEKGLVFSLDIDPSIPDCLIGDGHRICQIIINLISNAIKFTKKGSIVVRITNVSKKGLSLSLPGNVSLCIAVIDTGIGIPPEKQSLIFEPFTQADKNIRKEYGGTGLGLSIVKNLVSLMNGEISVISPVHSETDILNKTIKNGAEINFTINLALCHVEIENRFATNTPLELGFTRVVNVLVADDVEVNQLLAEIVLKGLGCEVDFANNGKQAIEMLDKRHYDIILMDVQMPVMDGYAATKIIRQMFDPVIPIIGLSANVYADDIDKSLAVGMNEHIGKPYTEKQLYDVIERWVISRE